MRSLLQSVQESFGQRRRNLRSVQVTIAEESGPCPRCGGAMGVQKTVRRCGRTLEHGSFEARESVYVCLAGCRQPSLEASLTLAAEALISIGVATKDTELLLRGVRNLDYALVRDGEETATASRTSAPKPPQ